ncbi:MAG: ZIP family metal transporter [Methylococcales bacterium]|jgi:zinc and cadmium transporter|nr:ZIP family metal transporter [Methylococcales bacterium]MBT3507440.1 ZIP family metal transporter [Methylococcales bacterium]MBT3698953.1 ZIP family metal transporter [Methylococcales bacterium]MBT3815003.1 ZIP family metal transporter [Methylococcales bacterium]MBT4032954.1 ZIP family metal transporter [Methylococcales bacterium]
MNLLVLIIIFTALGGVLSVLAASVFLWLPENKRNAILPHGISFSIGALLAVSFWGLIPHAFESVDMDHFQRLSATILAGLLSFFVLEKLLIWRHCHSGSCEAHIHEGADHSHEAAGTLIILGDSIHNFVDGILIAAAFLTDVNLGIVTSLAVAAHEIPQEVGDFAILLKSGYSRRKALFYNVLASLTTVLGGIVAYFGLADLHGYLPYFLVLAASSFIYIAVADLIPTLHKKTDMQSSLKQIALIAVGVTVICLLHTVAHDFEEQIPVVNMQTSLMLS